MADIASGFWNDVRWKSVLGRTVEVPLDGPSCDDSASNPAEETLLPFSDVSTAEFATTVKESSTARRTDKGLSWNTPTDDTDNKEVNSVAEDFSSESTSTLCGMLVEEPKSGDSG